jgi:hypothetical protein
MYFKRRANMIMVRASFWETHTCLFFAYYFSKQESAHHRKAVRFNT